jgi:hypothetical protein
MKRALEIILFCMAALALLLGATQPTKLPSFVLIVPFLLMFCALALGISLIIAWRSSKLTAKNVRIGALGAALPILLLVLQSIGQLTVRDVLIIVVLFVLAYFYVARMAMQPK